MNWRTGDFDRKLVPEIFHTFVPAHSANSLTDIDLDRLWAGGKRLILLDVDHTLVKWKAEDFSEPVIAWIERAKQMGFDLCIISNTRRVERLGRLREKLGVETVRGRFKPSRAMFRLALIKFKKKPEEAVMIGDQLMTDILGANRAGIDAIWVRKMEGKEFAGTRLNRMMERFFQSFIYRGLIAPVDEDPVATPAGSSRFVEKPIVRQFVKFVIVGVSSFIVDFSVRMFLAFYAPWGDRKLAPVLGEWLQANIGVFNRFPNADKAAWPIFVAIAAAFGILNSFVWNRMWTFRIRGKEERMSQLRRFVLISVIGLGLNVLISSGLNNVIQGHPKISAAVATVIAAACVAFWNFTGQRLYAFKPRNS